MKNTTGTGSRVAEEVFDMVEATRGEIVHAGTKNTPALYWRVGKRIKDATRGNTTSDKGTQILDRVAKVLTPTYGKEFSKSALKKMVNFCALFPDYEKVVSLSSDLNWEHFEQLLGIDDHVKRDFYSWMTLVKKWSVNVLSSKIKSEVYENTPSAKKSDYISTGAPEDYESALMSALVSRDRKLLAFLGIDEN